MAVGFKAGLVADVRGVTDGVAELGSSPPLSPVFDSPAKRKPSFTRGYSGRMLDEGGARTVRFSPLHLVCAPALVSFYVLVKLVC